MRPPPGGMIPESAQPAGLSDQERMANLIRQCMAPLPTVSISYDSYPLLKKNACICLCMHPLYCHDLNRHNQLASIIRSAWSS